MHAFGATSLLRRLFQDRLVLFLALLLIQLQFFTINLLNAQFREPTDGWELKIAAIDDNLTPNGLWLIPYSVGFVLSVLVPLWAMFAMPNRLYRQFILAMATTALVGYLVYILVPTYVTKPAPEQVPGTHALAQLLRDSYGVDAAASTHNAAPSQHVFYALIIMCFVIRFRPTRRIFLVGVAMGALISASTVLTMRHNSPDLISGYLFAVGGYYGGLFLGGRVTDWLGDGEEPIALPPLTLRLQQRIRRRLSKLDARSS
ncbi:MAG: phosphatase PAP2 family protein [Anaerolineae bacterium]|nr:phosphatase PAP2 family protein [Anaerolineae bacterium]